MINLEYDVDLSKNNTFALKSCVSHYIAITNEVQINQAVEFAKQKNLNIFILSGGSNLLLPEKFNALTLHMQNMGQEILKEDENHVIIRANAGENWHEFVCACCDKGYHGLENLALIPGKVGASPIQNIGAYGVEVGEFIDQIWSYDLKTNQHVVFKASDCNFAYRDSIFKHEAGRYIIYSVSFKLLKQAPLKMAYADVAARVGDAPTAKKLLDTIIAIRQSKLPQPEEFPNAGSFFKNPVIEQSTYEQLAQQFPSMPHYPQSNGKVKIAAGWLIEQAGWKGKRIGPVGSFERQALVLVNYSNASLSDVKNTYYAIQDDIFTKFAISLEPEPVLLDSQGVVQAHRCVF